MEKYRAIPEGYMTVGEIAKKMGVTVRTMQYYDKEKLIKPSAESDGGRRLYTYEDMIKLHQVLSMKSLGFSLNEIKSRIIRLDTPTAVAAALASQADLIKGKIIELSQSLKSIEMLKAEVLQMQTVDFKKYADIVINLQMKNEYFWLIKYFDNNTLDHIRMRFTQESGTVFINRFHSLWGEAANLQKSSSAPSSKEAQVFAEEFWKMVNEFTGGDTSIVPKLMEFSQKMSEDSTEWKQQQEVYSFIELAIGVYFENQNKLPIEECEK